MSFIDDIAGCISGKDVTVIRHEGHMMLECGNGATIIPIPVTARSPEEAAQAHAGLERSMLTYKADNPERKLVPLPEDVWRSRPDMMKARLLAQLGEFRSIFARNTSVRRITKPESAGFLNEWHTYGDAAARYRYGIFTKDGTLVAVATFSSGRKWLKDDRTIRSYEWVRYASLPGIRVIGGMGKVLKTFIREVKPDDIMSYADMEWTDGHVYTRLGFHEDGFRSPVAFCIDPRTWRRNPLDKNIDPNGVFLFHLNLGSRKFRIAGQQLYETDNE